MHAAQRLSSNTLRLHVMRPSLLRFSLLSSLSPLVTVGATRLCPLQEEGDEEEEAGDGGAYDPVAAEQVQ